MKKSHLFCLAILCVVSFWPQAISAQDTVAQPPKRLRHWAFGITAGLDRNYHSVDMVYMTDMRFDKFKTGTVYGVRIGYAPLKWLSFNTGAVMIQKNYHMNHVFEYYNLRYSLFTTTTNNYINVPLEVKFTVGRAVKLHLFGGGFDRIEVGAELRWYYSTTDIQKPYMTNLNPRYNTAVAAQFGISYWL